MEFAQSLLMQAQKHYKQYKRPQVIIGILYGYI